jgi:hypothetical protein
VKGGEADEEDRHRQCERENVQAGPCDGHRGGGKAETGNEARPPRDRGRARRPLRPRGVTSSNV